MPKLYLRHKKQKITHFLLGFLLFTTGLVPFFASQAFQIRNDNALRVMQSNPYAESASFRVSADMFIQPGSSTNVDNLVTPPVVVTPTVTPTTTNNNGGGSGGSGNDGGEKYDASDWLLSRKYDELVRSREEGDAPFLASAPEDPSQKFDYVPTKPSALPTPSSEGPPAPPKTPLEAASSAPDEFLETAPAADNKNLAPDHWQANTLQAAQNVGGDAESALTSAPPSNNLETLDVVVEPKQRLTTTGSPHNLVWQLTDADGSEAESWNLSAPRSETGDSCAQCDPLDWFSWCNLVFILLLLLAALLLALLVLLYRLFQQHKSLNTSQSFGQRLKELLKSLGLLALFMFVGGAVVPNAAQANTTPQKLIYEGELLDNASSPVVGTYTFRFSFWDNGDFEAGDVAAGVLNTGAADYLGWNEVQTTTTVSDGSFSLILSEVTPFVAGMFDQDNLFLQVEVKLSTDPDTSYEFVDINLADATDDRKIIASVPYAFNANKLDYRETGFAADNIPYLDVSGQFPNSVLPDIVAADLDLADITLADFTNDLALTSTNIFVGSLSNVATGVPLSGDATIDNAGVLTLGNDVVTAAKIGTAGLGDANKVLSTDGAGDPQWEDRSNFASSVLNSANILVGNASNVATGVALSGDATMSNTGTLTIANDAVTVAKLADNSVDTAAIIDGNVTAAKLGVGAVSGGLAGVIADGSLTADDLATDSVDSAEIVANAVGTAELADGSIALIDMATDSVDNTKIVDGSITAADLNLTDITLTDFTNDVGFLTAEVDGSVTNEIQTLSLAGSNLSISSGNTVDLSSLSGATITTGINGNSFTLDLDGDALATDTITLQFGNVIGETFAWDGTDSRFELSDDLQITGNLETTGTINGVTIGIKNTTQVLSPRYQGAIFEKDGTNNKGSMYEENETLVSGILSNIIRWFSTQTSLQDYDVIVIWTVPDDFNSFQAPALGVDYQTTGALADAQIDMTVERNNVGADEILGAGLDLNSNAWTNSTFTLNGATTWSAGDTLKIRFKLQAKDSNSAKLGNISINYMAQ